MKIQKLASSLRFNLHSVVGLLAIAATCSLAVSALAQVPTDLTGGQFTANCGNATAVDVFDDGMLASGQYGVNNVAYTSDPDIVLVGNQWWIVWANGPGPTRGLEPFMAYLPPGASLSTTTVYPADPNGWHIVGANDQGTGTALAVAPIVSPGGWDTIAAETPSVDVGPDGTTSVYYAGHNLGATNFEVGIQTNVVNGQGNSDPVPAMVAQQPWEFADGLGAVLEQSVRWIPQLNKFVMFYTAGAWWDSPPTNHLGYAESTDGINWVNRQELDTPVSYYNQDFVYNPVRNRFEMVISNDPTGVGGGNGRDLVWREAATPSANWSDWQNEVTLLQHNASNNADWYASGLLSPAVKYGNLPGEQNRMYVFFHAYSTTGGMSIGRFYCDANTPATPNFTLTPTPTALNMTPSSSTTAAIAVTPMNGFADSVNFTVAGLPAGVSGTLTPTSSSTGTTLNISVPPGAAAGRYPVTITGTDGSLIAATTITLNISGQAQTITFDPVTTPINYGSGPFTVNATASSGLPVTYSVGGNATITGNTVTMNGSGTIIIAANQDGDSTYSAAPQATTSVYITPLPQTINFPTLPTQTAGATLDLHPYIYASSGLPIDFTLVGIPSNVCSISGTIATFAHPGTCIVIAFQWGGNGYAEATPQGQAVTVTQATPKISWLPPAPIIYGTPLGAAQLNATSSTPGAFVYSSPAGTILAPGPQILSVLFTPTDTTDYTSATAQVTINVSQPTVSLGVASGTQTYEVWTNFVIGPIFTGSRVPTGTVTLSNNGAAIVTLPLGGNGKAYYTTQPPLNVGVNNLTASYSGDKYFPPGLSATTTITVLPAPVNFQASCYGAQWYGASYQCTVNLSASTTSAPGGVITYSFDGGSPATVPIVNGNAPFTLPVIPPAGSHTLVLNYAAQGNFAAAGPLTRSFTTQQGQTQLQAYPSSYWLAAGSSLTISGTATTPNSGIPPGSVTVYDNGVAIGTAAIGATGNISYNVTNIAKGSHKYYATYSGSSNYSAATSATSTVTAN